MHCIGRVSAAVSKQHRAAVWGVTRVVVRKLHKQATQLCDRVMQSNMQQVLSLVSVPAAADNTATRPQAPHLDLMPSLAPVPAVPVDARLGPALLWTLGTAAACLICCHACTA